MQECIWCPVCRMLSQNRLWTGGKVGQTSTSDEVEVGRLSKRGIQHSMPQASTDSLLIDMKNASLVMAIMSKSGL